jgi:hypothetical protein
LPAVYSKRKAFKDLVRQSGKEPLSLKQVTKIVLENISSVETKPLK